MQKTSQLSRRNFLTAGTGAAVSAAFGTQVLAEEQPREKTAKNSVKFSVFADIHHFPGVFYSQTPKHLVEIQERAVRENCEFIIHCGDFCHHPHKEKEFINQYMDFKIPGYHTCGNHDFDGCSFEETMEAYRLEKGYYFFDRGGFRFVILDANYFRNEDGTFTHYGNGNYFKYRGNAISIIPPEQMSWLAETLEKSPYPCALFSHQSFEREVGGIANWKNIRDLIDSTNQRHPGRVRLCVNGHHHRDFIRVLNGVVYFDLNSATHEWVEKRHNFYPEELCKEYSMVNHTLVFEDPVHAVVTMDSDGLLKIEGMKSQMLYGITRTKAGMSFADGSGRPVTPEVQSAEMRLSY